MLGVSLKISILFIVKAHDGIKNFPCKGKLQKIFLIRITKIYPLISRELERTNGARTCQFVTVDTKKHRYQVKNFAYEKYRRKNDT